MKKYLLSFSWLLSPLLLQAQHFTLTGTTTGQVSGKLTLHYPGKDGKYVHDSSLISNDRFEFRGNIAEPTMAYLGDAKATNMDQHNSTAIFLEPAVMTIRLNFSDFSSAVVTGSRSQDEFAELQKIKAPVFQEMAPLEKAFKEAGDAHRKAIKAKKDDATIDTLKYKAA